MSAKAFIGDHKTEQFEGVRGMGITPQCSLGIATNRSHQHQLLNPGLVQTLRNKRRFKAANYDGPAVYNIRESLAELGNIDLTDHFVKPSLFVSGTRNSIIRMFQEADQNLQISVALPPGLFVGVHRQEHLIKKDTIIIRITCIEPPEMTAKLGLKSVGVKRGNFYQEGFTGKKVWNWNWFDISRELNVTTSGDVSIHPRALERPLKNLFDSNKWW